MAKRSQPALYELIRDRNDSAAPIVTGGSRSGPPRTLAVSPVAAGCLLAVALAVVIGAYLYGFSMGERAARGRAGQQASADLDRLANAKQAPLATPSAILDDQPSARATEPDGSGNLASTEASTPANPPSAGGDPRIEGLNYFVIAQVPAPSADRMVAFCRERDLDAHSVPDDTGGLRFVIVTPGFAAGDRRSEPVLRLEARIRSVGLQWKSAARGNRDFSDFYPRKHAVKPG